MRWGHLLGLRWGVRPGIASVLALLLLSSFAGVATAAKKKKHGDVENIGKRDINKGSLNLYSTDGELALGDWLARNFELTTQRLKDPLITDYVNAVAELVVRPSDPRMPLRIRVIVSDEVNAIALPGGHFFITTGLIQDTQSEAELASVIAHEVAHLAARHVTKQLTKREMWTWMSLPLALVGGPIAYTVSQGLQLAGPLAFLQFSHNAEHEADFLGLQYHYASGYDPVAFLDFFERMKQREKSRTGGIAKAFSGHLMTKRRIEVTGGPDGRAIEGASVYVKYERPRTLAKDKKIEMNVKTNREGTARVPDLPRGKVLIQVIAEGWKPFGRWYNLEEEAETIKVRLEKPPRWY